LLAADCSGWPERLERSVVLVVDSAQRLLRRLQDLNMA
jgi:hypothetical protein